MDNLEKNIIMALQSFQEDLADQEIILYGCGNDGKIIKNSLEKKGKIVSFFVMEI